MNRNWALILGGIALVLLCCCLVAAAGLAVAGAAVYRTARSTEFAPLMTEIWQAAATPTASPEPVLILTPLPTPPPASRATLDLLNETLVPQRDLRELAIRLRGIPDIPRVVSNTPADYHEGDEVEFNASNTNTDERFTVTARLVYRSDNVYFFAENGVEVDRAAVREMVAEFQDHTYPTNHEFFGTEWTPGVDGDPRLYVLYARNLGATGYYSSKDEYSRLAHPHSNEKEMFYINADQVAPGDFYIRGTLAHEFQHMIHWNQDRNEETWLNEGASELAGFLNDFGPSDWSGTFVASPDLQLNTWSEEGSGGAHYGAGFMFVAYFLDRFGEAATRALVAAPENGLSAVDRVLADEAVIDPGTGQPVSADDVFADWVVANYLGNADVADGRYDYIRFFDAPTVGAPTEAFYRCPVATYAATVQQYAADYYEFNCPGQFTLNFTGSLQQRVVPAEPHGGRYGFWANRGDDSNTTLTRAFDLTGVSSASLRYWAWWQIETDWDYAYVEVSVDGGQTWDIQDTAYGTDSNPHGNSFGWGYTGESGGWVQETVDLSAYAGQQILVRFEYVTDDAANRPGFLLDDISVPELDYAEDFESDAGGWESAGWVRMDNLLPQTFRVQVIRLASDPADSQLIPLELDELNRGSLPLDIGRGERLVLVVSGTTRFTTEPASYQFEVTR